MSKSQALRWVNARIDTLILTGRTQTAEYARLIALHLILSR